MPEFRTGGNGDFGWFKLRHALRFPGTLHSVCRCLAGVADICCCLVLCDVQSGNDLLLSLRGSGELFVVLEGDAELFGEVFALFDGAAVVGFAFGELVGDGV